MSAKAIARGAHGRERELVLPSSALSALRTSLLQAAGPSGAYRVLQDAGHESGLALFRLLADRAGERAPADLAPGAFWDTVRGVLRRRGWGTFHHRRVHSGLGLLSSSDCAEADPGGPRGDPEARDADPAAPGADLGGARADGGCALTAGALMGLLGRAADGPIAVLEVGCRSRGDAECRFAFGSEAAVHELYRLLLDGKELEDALETL